uniref:Uncharacterized protein AlNc14C78G5152 n=1 Tax=Albugo laibachii Nc14 TaxID=890382 RepID=F0WEV3_9STRA|nr:conserved hypothetical protein [Albugo laibachii Nc14]|eukprot:CCA19735.1 conserved hypothetical protein [Albugo laibachii Nc14]
MSEGASLHCASNVVNNNNKIGPTKKNPHLPLPENYFQPPALSQEEKKYLITLAKRACKEVVRYSRPCQGPVQWIHLCAEEGGVEVYQGVDQTSRLSVHSGSIKNRNLTYLRGVAKVYATIDEIADFFKLDTPEKIKSYQQTIASETLDDQTLYNLALPTPRNPYHYVGVKWSAIESPSRLARNRDFSYIECHDEFMDTTGNRRGWVRSLHSIRLPCCPSLEKSHGLVRGSMYRSGYIFLEVQGQPNIVEVIHTLHIDLKGNAPSWLQVQAMRRRIRDIAAINQYFQLQRVLQGHLIGDLELPFKKDVVQCQLCSLSFGLFHRRWQCRKCGLKICTTCSEHFQVNYAGTGTKKVRICRHCVDTGKRSRRLFPVGFSKKKYLTQDFVLRMHQNKACTQSARSLQLPCINSSPAMPTRHMGLASRYSHGLYHDHHENRTQNRPGNTNTATTKKNAGSGFAHSYNGSDEFLQEHEINEILESKRLQNDFETKQRDKHVKMKLFANKQAASFSRNGSRQIKNVSFSSSGFTPPAPLNVLIASESTPLAKSSASLRTSGPRADSTGMASFQNIGKKSFFSRYDFEDEQFRDLEDGEDVFASMQSIKTDRLRGDGELGEIPSGSKDFDIALSPSNTTHLLETSFQDQDHAPSSLGTSLYYQHTRGDIIDSQYEPNWTSSSRTEGFEERFRNENIGCDAARVAAQAFTLKETEDAAIRMALAAMKLFEKENDGELQVPPVTRQAALSKMTEMYRQKFQRDVCSSQFRASSRPSQFSCDTTQESKNGSDRACSDTQEPLDLSQLENRTTDEHHYFRMRSHTRPMRSGPFRSNDSGLQWQGTSSCSNCFSNMESNWREMKASDLKDSIPTTVSTASKSDYETQADYELYTSRDDSLVEIKDVNDSSLISERNSAKNMQPSDLRSDMEQKPALTSAREQRTEQKRHHPRFSATFIASSKEVKREGNPFYFSRIPGEPISQQELDKLRESLLQLMSECMSE